MTFDQNLLSLFIVLAIWDIVWKAIGMWKAARNGQKYWFVALMIVNSMGIVPIIYIKFYQKKR